MLTIRLEQMRALTEGAIRAYENRMMAHLREWFPEQTAEMDDESLREFVRDGTRSGERHGLERECDFELFLDHLVHYGPAFEQLTWVKPILTNASLSGQDKLQLLGTRQLILESR